MRDRFHEQLQQLSEALITMGALCEEAISDAAKSYFTGDRRLGERAGQLEQQIDQQQRDIEGLCMQLLLRQQPVARDLRTISAAMRMISDMERIGDQAADIAEIARDVQAGKLADPHGGHGPHRHQHGDGQRGRLRPAGSGPGPSGHRPG